MASVMTTERGFDMTTSVKEIEASHAEVTLYAVKDRQIVSNLLSIISADVALSSPALLKLRGKE